MGLPSFSKVVVLVSLVVIVVLGGYTGLLPVLLYVFGKNLRWVCQLLIVVCGGSRGLPLVLPHVIGLLRPRFPSAALAW
jgi:hypothetical protein